MVAENEQALAQGGLGGGDHGVEFLRGTIAVALGERGLKPKHGVDHTPGEAESGLQFLTTGAPVPIDHAWL